jgi:hypothetical protein
MSTLSSNPCFDDIYNNIHLRKIENFVQKSDDSLRLIILEEEQFKLCHTSKWNIKVLMGVAWLSSQRRDYILLANDSLVIPKQTHNAILSTLDKKPVLLEISRV